MEVLHALARLASAAAMGGLLSATAASPVAAGPYPDRPVTIITPSGAGAGPDVITRIVAARFTQAWGRQVVVLNRPGAGGLTAAQAVTAAEADGYTLYLPLGSTFVVLPETNTKLPLDLDRDIAPIGLVGEQPMMIAVHPSLGVNTLAELIAAARNRPGEILYGAGRGTMPHLAGALLAHRAGIDLTFVPYPTATRALADALGGTIPLFLEASASLAGAVRGGQLKALAVASATRLPDMPDVPTVAEAVPALVGFQARGWFALAARAGTPDVVMQQVGRTLQAALAEPEIKEKLAALGTYPRPLSPAETIRFIHDEQALWRPLVRQIGLTAQ